MDKLKNDDIVTLCMDIAFEEGGYYGREESEKRWATAGLTFKCVEERSLGGGFPDYHITGKVGVLRKEFKDYFAGYERLEFFVV